MSIPASNPFATRWTRPGELPYVFRGAESLEACCQRALASRRSQIVGPHGVGKSTLVCQLLRAFSDRGQAWERWRVGPEGRVDQRQRAPAAAGGDPVLVVDGWEQLPFWRRCWLRWTARRLLVTTHRDLGWTVVLRPEPSETLACQLAKRLQRDFPEAARIGDQEVVRCYRQAEGNLRETLFLLYDAFETRSQAKL